MLEKRSLRFRSEGVSPRAIQRRNLLPEGQLRSALRDRTSAIHARLDALVGPFQDRGSYAEYLRGTLVFRQALEGHFHASRTWKLAALAPLVRQDLRDLGISAAPPARLPDLGKGEARLLGAAYVAEGSALGARLLVRRARDLGFDANFGARHLTAQAEDRRRWPDFLALLDRMEPSFSGDALDAAERTFAFALSAYAGELA